ncbi:hypothetical protein BGX27_003007 [Mortierella sp. AM989]|nr:hypothetical protein BGX27_003007 [Mortierella sp. AM989]
MTTTIKSETDGLHSTRVSEEVQPLTEVNILTLLKEQQQESQSDELDAVSSSSSQLNPLDIKDAIECTILKNASFQTKALYDLTEDMAEAAADVVILGKRKAEGEESQTTVSTSSKDGVSAKRIKRTCLTCPATSNEKADALDAGRKFLKETRLLAEVRNETLRLHTMAQFVLLRSMLAMNSQATSLLNRTDKISPPTSSLKSPRSSPRIASKLSQKK